MSKNNRARNRITTIDLTVGQGAYTFEFGEGTVMNGTTQEHIKEAAPVLSQYCDAIGVRSSELVTSSSQAGESSAHADNVLRSATRGCSMRNCIGAVTDRHAASR